MEHWDLYIRIGPRRRGTKNVALKIRFLPEDAPSYDVQLDVKCGEVALDSTSPDLVGMGALAQAVADAIAGARGTPGFAMTWTPARLLVDVDAPDLCSADWESILSLPPLSAAEVVRMRNVSDERALLPFELPMRILDVRHAGGVDASPTDGAMRYFRQLRASNLADTDVVPALRAGRYDIVHIQADARRSPDGPGELSIEGTTPTSHPSWIDATALRHGLTACKARLLVLQASTPGSYAPLLDIAHRLLRHGGPTTLILDAATTETLDQLYMGIVHDQPLGRWMVASAPPGRFAMLCSVGGDQVLRISPMARRLARAARRSASTLDTLLTRTAYRLQPVGVGFAGAALPPDPMEELASTQRALADRSYDYSHESGAWIPLPEDTRLQAQNDAEVQRLRRAVARVVNLGIADGHGMLSPDEVLRPGEAYELTLQIGCRASWSVIDGDAAFPEQALERHYVDNGVELRVVVFAQGFEVDVPDQRLRLEQPPAESAELRFGLVAPREAGRYRVRVCIYHEQNLLQSILVRVAVHAGPRRSRDAGIHAEVEFALSENLVDFERLPKRTLSLLANATDTGSHTLAVVGSTLRTSFDFGETEMRSAVDAARKALLDIAADTSVDPPRYRFDDNNRTSIERLAQDAIQLAQLGYLLYSNIVTGKDREFEKELREALGTGGATIQVAAVKSARYVFPWAVVYDHPLVVGPATLCADFRAALSAGQSLATQNCLVGGCPNRGKTDIVCPSGFWGFKHLVEQPLSVSDATAGELVLEIDAGPATADMPALMVVSRELQQVSLHEKEMGGGKSFKFQVRDTKAELGQNMQSMPLDTNLYYFYCHGGRSKARTWLGIGNRDQLVASDLNAWGVDWSDKHPLVFINGCHTVDLTPDDLLSFNQAFAWCRAAGVIGTEISIPEGLARGFASGFMPRFAAGTTVGDALRQQRLVLLQGCNLLGLVYTAYCSTDLRVVRH